MRDEEEERDFDEGDNEATRVGENSESHDAEPASDRVNDESECDKDNGDGGETKAVKEGREVDEGKPEEEEELEDVRPELEML